MALTKEERVQISEKIVSVDKENAVSDLIAQQLGAVKTELTKKDDANKTLVSLKTNLIDAYQDEQALIDGVAKTKLTETEFLDSANKVLGNTFFPNDKANPVPSITGGVWKYYTPYSKTHAVGRDSLEALPAPIALNENAIISQIQAEIITIEAVSISRRATGKVCNIVDNGTCDNPLYTDQATCELNGGIWTPVYGPDEYIADPVTTTGLTNIKSLVTQWKNLLNSQTSTVPTDSNTTRQTQNDAAKADITTALSNITSWESIQDFDTTTSLPPGIGGTGCTLFDGKVESDYQQAKLQPTTLQILKDELSARITFTATRVAQITTNLGSITQDLNSGSITAATGLYGERMYLIDSRLNLLKGTLNQKLNADRGIGAQEASKESNNNTNLAYQSVMSATLAVAPGIGLEYINVKDSSLFAVNDRIFVYASGQEELSGKILEIQGNRIKLTFKVPTKYTTESLLRIYKEL